MNRLLKILFLIGALGMLRMPAFAQSQPTITTLSSAEAAPNSCAGSQCTMAVTSATGITASTNSLQQFCLVDSELQQVVSISGTTITVRRGRQGFAAAHVSGAYVVCGVTGSFDPKSGNLSYAVGSPTVGASVTGATFISSLPVGSCTRSNMGILPVFVVTAQPTGVGRDYGYSVDCLNGTWVPGTLPSIPTNRALACASTVPIGSVAYGSFGASITDVIAEFVASVYVPQTCYVTGVKALAGTGTMTDNVLGTLRDTGGTLIANSATAGVALSGASTFQTLAFVNKTLLVGPALYFIGVQGSGTTANQLATIAASTFIDVEAAQETEGVFGTLTNPLTVPTTFTASKGPIAYLYY